MSFLDRIENRTRADHVLAALINADCPSIGGIYNLDYSRAIVLTDDFRKSEAGGVPLGGFLLAAAGDQTGEGFVLADEELILLRVRGTAPLPNDSELVQTRLAVVRDATNSGRPFDAVTDALTRNELQQSAFDCEVIGTFYTDTSEGPVEFGADVDNVVASAKYQVFLPSKNVLEWIASYSESDEDDTVRIGAVRFSSTRRRARAAGTDTAAVHVHIADFIARKTAVFGMTRTGKSNTIKTLVAAVNRYASERDESIGQLIFDPQGEYANINEQDRTGLRLLGDADTVRIYRMGADGQDPQVRPLGMNFFDLDNFAAVTEFVCDAVTAQYGTYAFVKNFAAIKWEEPDRQEISDHSHWTRVRLGMYGILAECGFTGELSRSSGSPSIDFVWSKAEFDAFNDQNPGLVREPNSGTTYRVTTPRAARTVALYMAQTGGWDARSARSGGGDAPFKHIAEFLNRASGKAAVRSLLGFHSTHSRARVEEQVWDDMGNGRLSIVDLSHGTGDVQRIISENIVNYLLARANERFRNAQKAVRFQIVVEEAHNLFERGAKDVAVNPWVRLSKEAAKYKIGLVYATQEVSSVDQRILSNTSNWLVAHLNSDNETKELSHYYDFKTWADSIRRCEDIGFVRMKTYSGKYIVPVQVAKFDHAMINEARQAAGLNPVAADGNAEGS
ncbi:ATP-binding protein [Mycolicibacterium sp. jd]|uniref:ATP-binding protein n=1 Tax=unclassified Mycolicibacterium TaxID=2636767 RepID=UPI00351B3ED7